jgi:hypothetical protein
MTINYPGPYEVRINYTTTSSSLALSHQQHLSVILDAPLPIVGTAFSAIVPRFRITPGGAFSLQSVVDAWVVQMKAMYSSGAGNTIDSAELWQYEDESFDASFVSSYTIAVAGTSGSAVQAAGQSITTMRTQEGGIFKLNFLESIIAPAITDTGTIAQANLETMVAGLEAGNVFPWVARDTSYPISRIAHYPGQNERLWKKRNRP